MALSKVRALHPDIFSDEDVCDVSIAARWLFAGLWCFACDNGHLADKPKQIKRWIFATDEVSAADLLRELEAVGLIERGNGWITVPGLCKRQRVDRRYFKTCDREGCQKPEPAAKPDSQPETQRGHDGTTQSHAGPTRGHATDGDGDGVRDGDGEGDGEELLSPASAGKRQPKRATRRPADFRPSQQHIDLAAELGVDLRAEWAKFCDWSDAKGATYKDWPAGLRNWLRNARPTPASRSAQHLALARDLAAREHQPQHPQIGELA